MHDFTDTAVEFAPSKMARTRNLLWLIGLGSIALSILFLLGVSGVALSIAVLTATRQRELDVVLPGSDEARPLVAVPEAIVVHIDKGGGYSVSGQPRSAEEVEQILRRAVSNDPLRQSVIIRADKHVSFDHVVTMMNLCNKVGIIDYKVTTAEEE